MKMPDTPEMNQLTKLHRIVDHVCIKVGQVKDDPVIWEFNIIGEDGKTEVIEIDAEKLEKQSVFRAQFLKKLFKPAPKVDSSDWLKFLQIMGENAEIIPNPEESQNVRVARKVFEKICIHPVEKDNNLSMNMGFYSHQGYYCLLPRIVENIIYQGGYKISLDTLSKTMTDLGLKKPGTQSASIGGRKPINCWWFYPDEIESRKGGK